MYFATLEALHVPAHSCYCSYLSLAIQALVLTMPTMCTVPVKKKLKYRTVTVPHLKSTLSEPRPKTGNETNKSKLFVARKQNVNFFWPLLYLV